MTTDDHPVLQLSGAAAPPRSQPPAPPTTGGPVESGLRAGDEIVVLRGDLRGMYGTIEQIDPDGRNVTALLPIPDMRKAEKTRQVLTGHLADEDVEREVRHILARPRRVRFFWRDVELR